MACSLHSAIHTAWFDRCMQGIAVKSWPAICASRTDWCYYFPVWENIESMNFAAFYQSKFGSKVYSRHQITIRDSFEINVCIFNELWCPLSNLFKLSPLGTYLSNFKKIWKILLSLLTHTIICRQTGRRTCDDNNPSGLVLWGVKRKLCDYKIWSTGHAWDAKKQRWHVDHLSTLFLWHAEIAEYLMAHITSLLISSSQYDVGKLYKWHFIVYVAKWSLI